MAVSVPNVPGNIRTPLFYLNFRPGAAPYQGSTRLLLIGHKSSGAPMALNQPMVCADNMSPYFGDNSMLAGMYRLARMNAPMKEIWVAAVDEPSGAKATATVTFTAPVTDPVTLVYYLGGHRCAVYFKPSDTIADMAAALADAFNGTSAAAMAVAAAGVVTLTARHQGESGNSLRIETRLHASDGFDADAFCTITPFTGGTGTIVQTSVLAALGDQEFDTIVSPADDSFSRNEMRDFFDHASGRWSPMQQLYGHYVYAYEGTLGSQLSDGTTRNNPHETAIAVLNVPQPTWEWSAGWGAIMARELEHPNSGLRKPLHAVKIRGLMPPKNCLDQFDRMERNALYYAGRAGWTVDREGSIILDRCCTSYQKNAWGSPDRSWLDAEALYRLVYIARKIRSEFTAKFERVGLRDQNIGQHNDVVTVDDIRDACISAYRRLMRDDGLVEDIETFKARLIVERDASDPDRVNIYWPFDLGNDLRVLGIDAESFLEFSDVSVDQITSL